MDKCIAKKAIAVGETALGIEFGSTRIKSVLIDLTGEILATGSFQWENRLENDLWTYHLDDAVKGMQESFRTLSRDVFEKYALPLEHIGYIGISGMMHGIIALDAEDRQLTPFLTWRNTNTYTAAKELTELFDFNVPLRWSISHLYNAILNREAFVDAIAYVSTLSGYIHYLLTGEKVIGVGEASGMFPIDSGIMDFDPVMVNQFEGHIASYRYSWKLKDIFPKVLTAGMQAGSLTQKGAKLLDPSGTLRPGIPMAPPEGDAGTGMVATNSVAACTGNVSVGTSIFSMVVLERPLSKLYADIDMVTTPSGRPVAMIHCNNGSSELDSWMRIFAEAFKACDVEVDTGLLYDRLFTESLQGDPDCSKVVLYNYVSGEPVMGFPEGVPLLLRRNDSKFNLANFMRSHLYSILAALAYGSRILTAENVHIRRLTGHGGLFKTPNVAQRYMAAALASPVYVMKASGEGGPYGMALLAAYLNEQKQMSLEQYLEECIFANEESSVIEPTKQDIEGYRSYFDCYCRNLPVEQAALDARKLL